MLIFNKRLVLCKQKIALNYLKEIRGISDFGIIRICAVYGINPYTDWTNVDTGLKLCLRWRQYAERLPRYALLYNVNYVKFSFDITAYSMYRVHKYMRNNSLRGFLHKKGLPVRGQRTHTNRYTQRALAHIRWGFILNVILKHKSR